MKQELCGSEVRGVSSNLRDEAVDISSKWLDEGAVPPNVEQGTRGLALHPQEIRIELVESIRCPIPFGE